MKKIKVEEVIVVEGRDDTAAINQAVDGITIETHGFGIRKQTWDLIEKAYKTKGIIIFTDPDYSGEEIRSKLLNRFPDSKQAFLPRKAATKSGDIGIENATPESIIEALKKSHYTSRKTEDRFTNEDLVINGLIGRPDSKLRREKIGDALGIGYGNGKSLLKKLNQFNISKDEFLRKVKEL